MIRRTIVPPLAAHAIHPPTLRTARPGTRLVGAAAGAILLTVAATFAATSSDEGKADAPVTRGLRGTFVDPLGHGDDDIAVLVFTQTECPIARRYAPEIARLQQRFAADGARFWLVYPDRDDDRDRVRRQLDEYVYGCAVALDPEHRLVARAGATVTPEAAVFVGQTLVYRGRITDRETDFGMRRKEASVHDLEDAVAAVVSGREPTNAFTEAVGCYIQDLP